MVEKSRTSKVTKIFFKTIKLLFLTMIFFVTLFLLIATYLIGQIPSEKQFKSCFVTTMYQVNLCPSASDYVHFGEISSFLIKSVVMTEDSTFWTHNGFDFTEIERSLKKNVEEKRFARGGSTITQQLAKNLFLTKEKTILRKIKEAIITTQLEKKLTKKEILEKYLNVVQFGKGLFGVKKASQFYFQKSPKDLDVVESAFLTFLLPSPESYSKSFYKKQLTPFASNRLKTIIDRLFQFQRISENEYEQAIIKLDHFLKPAEEQLDFEDAEENQLNDKNELTLPDQLDIEENPNPEED